MSMDDIDTGEGATANDTPDGLQSGQLGEPGAGKDEFDIEFSHPRQTGIVTVFAADEAEAKALLKSAIEERYGAPEDLVVLDIEKS